MGGLLGGLDNPFMGGLRWSTGEVNWLKVGGSCGTGGGGAWFFPGCTGECSDEGEE